MTSIPPKVQSRLVAEIRKFQPVLASAKSRDVNESDTVIIVTDILSDVFGYDKYSEITSEHAIRGTYCDLAIRLNDKLEYLIEVKAVGLELKDQYVKQAVDYAANLGVDWVILTNGVSWKMYKVSFSKPIDQELVIDLDFLSLNSKSKENLECLFFICKEGWIKSAINEYHAQKQVLSRFSIGALLTTDPVLTVIKKELKKLSPSIKIENDQIKNVIIQEILKREVVEGEKAEEAKKKINRLMSKSTKPKLKKVTVGKEEVEKESVPVDIIELPKIIEN